MLPKRKIIKKRHQRPTSNANPADANSLSLIEKLRSTDLTECEEALALLASLCMLE